jgi:hypothetical protein
MKKLFTDKQAQFLAFIYYLRASNKTSPAAFPNEQQERPGERVIAQARWM